MDWLGGGENKPAPKPLKKPSGRDLELVPVGEQESKFGEEDGDLQELDLQDEKYSYEEGPTATGEGNTTNTRTSGVTAMYKIQPNKFAFQQSKIYLFVKDDFHWSFTCFLAWVFFFVAGVPPLNGYGYADWVEDKDGEKIPQEDDEDPMYAQTLNICKETIDTSANRWQIFTCDPDAENIVSGPGGSGVVVISALLAVACSLIFITRFLQYNAKDAHPEFKVLGYRYVVDLLLEQVDRATAKNQRRGGPGDQVSGSFVSSDST